MRKFLALAFVLVGVAAAAPAGVIHYTTCSSSVSCF